MAQQSSAYAVVDLIAEYGSRDPTNRFIQLSFPQLGPITNLREGKFVGIAHDSHTSEVKKVCGGSIRLRAAGGYSSISRLLCHGQRAIVITTAGTREMLDASACDVLQTRTRIDDFSLQKRRREIVQIGVSHRVTTNLEGGGGFL